MRRRKQRRQQEHEREHEHGAPVDDDVVVVDESLPTIQQPAIPAAADEPSAQVLDELLTFFGVRHGHHGATRTGEVPAVPAAAAAPAAARAAPPPPSPSPSPSPPPPPPPAAAAPASPSAPADDAVATSAATRVLGAGDELVPAPTRRSTRRSRKEAKREERLAEKRLAELAKERAAAAKGDTKRRGRKRRKDEAAAAAAAPVDAGESVRIIPGPPPSTAPAPDAPSAPPPPSPPAAAPATDRPTVSIGGDDVPDAVYLEGSLEAGSDRPATVFIDDKDPATGTIVSMEVATASARIEPRLRDRRVAVRRAVGRKRLKWIAAGVGATAVVIAALAVLGSGLFAVKHVTIEGAVYSRGDALDAVVEDLQGTNVLRLDTEAAERRLERIPWVADARVTTDFPNSAVVEIRERRPVLAYEGGDQRFRVLDPDGRVLAVLDGQPVGYLPLVVNAAEAPNNQPGEFVDDGYRAAAALATSLGPLREQVESIAVDVAGTDLRLTFVNGLDVRFGAANDLEVKLVRLQTALQNADPDNPPNEMIDVSTNPYVMR